MSDERPVVGASRERREDSPRAYALGRVVLWAAMAAVLAGVLVAAGWAALRHRAYLRDAHAVGALNHKVAVFNRPLSGNEFETALALCGAGEAETRFTGLAVAAADATRRNPDREPQVRPVAVRLLDDPEPVVRAKAIKALAGLRAREHLDRIRPMLQAALRAAEAPK